MLALYSQMMTEMFMVPHSWMVTLHWYFLKVRVQQKERLKYVKGLFPNSLISPSNMSEDETRQTFMVSSDTKPRYFLSC